MGRTHLGSHRGLGLGTCERTRSGQGTCARKQGSGGAGLGYLGTHTHATGGAVLGAWERTRGCQSTCTQQGEHGAWLGLVPGNAHAAAVARGRAQNRGSTEGSTGLACKPVHAHAGTGGTRARGSGGKVGLGPTRTTHVPACTCGHIGHHNDVAWRGRGGAGRGGAGRRCTPRTEPRAPRRNGDRHQAERVKHLQRGGDGDGGGEAGWAGARVPRARPATGAGRVSERATLFPAPRQPQHYPGDGDGGVPACLPGLMCLQATRSCSHNVWWRWTLVVVVVVVHVRLGARRRDGDDSPGWAAAVPGHGRQRFAKLRFRDRRRQITALQAES